MMRLLLVSQKSSVPPGNCPGGKNRRSPPVPPSFVPMVTAPWPATVTGALKLTLVLASSVRRLVLVQENGAVISMTMAPAPVFTVTSPEASMLVRSLTFSTAFFAVGEQTPALQLMFLVAADEIFTAACAAFATSTANATADIRRRDCFISLS